MDKKTKINSSKEINPPEKYPEIQTPEKHPEIQPPIDPEDPIIPEKDPDFIPEEEPFIACLLYTSPSPRDS